MDTPPMKRSKLHTVMEESDENENERIVEVSVGPLSPHDFLMPHHVQSGASSPEDNFRIDVRTANAIDILKAQLDEQKQMIHQLKVTNCELSQKIDLLVSQKQLLVKLGEQRDKLNYQLKKQNQHLHYVRLKMKTKTEFKISDQQQKNPLLHDVVVCNIFKYIEEPADLLNSRLVCRKWNQYSIPGMRKKFVKTFIGQEIQKLPLFVDIMERTKDFPITQFQIGGFPIRNFYKSLEKFFHVCGTFLCAINLKLEAISSMELQDFIFPLVPNLECLAIVLPTEIPATPAPPPMPRMENANIALLQKLKKLEIMEVKGIRIDTNLREKFCSTLFEHSPNVKVLEVRTGYLDTITNVLASVQLYSIPLRELYLDCPINEKDLVALNEMRLQLVTLRIGYFCEDVQEDTIENLLATSKKTLTKLYVSDYVGSGGKSLVINFPEMEKLKALEMLQPPGLSRPRQIIFVDLFRKNQFPVLKRIVLRYSNFGNADLTDVFRLVDENILVCETVEELEMPKSYRIVATIPSVAKTFPRLKKLKMEEPSDDVIRAVYLSLATLETLSIRLTQVNSCADSIITGIPPEICENLQGTQPGYMTGSYSMENKKGKDQFVRIVTTKLAISNLSRLTKLELICYPEQPLTDVGVYFGLFYLNKLTDLFIKSSDITKEGRATLRKRLHRLDLEPPKEVTLPIFQVQE